MIVVDTSVWIDVINEVDSPQATRCRELIRDEAPLALTDVVLTEVLQGLTAARRSRQVEASLRDFPILRLEALEDFVLASELFRTARKSGISVPTLDCLIAAPCVRAGAPLLHADADFDRLASCTPLRVFD